tara:strand:+ start:291 stop:878 length:588 start_codon:yes stop_codon:yes gene_type:complete
MEDVVEKTDEQIVVLTLSDKEYFKIIIDRYEKKLRRYIYRLAKVSYEDVEDLLQNIFIKTYCNLNAFDTYLSFSSWIYRITHNEVISWYRKQAVRPEGNILELSDWVLQNISDDFDFLEELDAKNLLHVIKQALNILDLKYREVIILRFIEEKEYKEISDILEKPINTVSTLISRGKKELKKILEKDNFTQKYYG